MRFRKSFPRLDDKVLKICSHFIFQIVRLSFPPIFQMRLATGKNIYENRAVSSSSFPLVFCTVNEPSQKSNICSELPASGYGGEKVENRKSGRRKMKVLPAQYSNAHTHVSGLQIVLGFPHFKDSSMHNNLGRSKDSVCFMGLTVLQSVTGN